MPAILAKRIYYYDTSDSSAWVWARWLLFIIFLVVVVLYVFIINTRRRRSGRDPIRGTAWLAPPPSYGISQNHYNQPTNQNPVPVYTENANANDAGYFDQQGKFHPTGAPVVADDVPQPEPAVTRDDRHSLTTSSSSSIEYQRPQVPPPTETAYQRPPGPPPSAAEPGASKV
ncbi:resistance to Congo red protein [Lachancea thermotolerans CBS 6340]|uniref:KLTH0G16104p n=1 Tax=Lachancea thermotolerans (strain ATCC 56472 / CBS 6340 / NRRL Y-8284) TaxID=559295 RepID=C5DND6_LACTC|nr:KLTH0G16104p [Lachancea thermotolerans CBS 6340]CAR25297.1 KLTH0G16104p [Lachancea thermotolerans CBS 6340]